MRGNSMIRVLVLTLVLSVLPLCVRAQVVVCGDPNAVIVAKTIVEATLQYANASSSVVFELVTGRSANGQISHTVDPRTIRFSGEDAAVDGATTAQIFDVIAKSSVAKGVALGYPTCPISCDAPVVVSVAFPSCVTRAGQGIGTTFDACGTGCCTRYYSVCCLTGVASPSITLLQVDTKPCVGGLPTCEPTCP